METLVHETFSQFGSVSSSSLLDSLKLLGFYYATNAGISINIEDLKTPNVKREFIKTANDEIVYISKQWEQGFVSDTERFQTIIDSWNVATESLKDRIVEYYQNAGALIQGIDNSVDPNVDYEFIYQSVLKVQNYVEQSMWEEAKEEYITTYFVLKNKYI